MCVKIKTKIISTVSAALFLAGISGQAMAATAGVQFNVTATRRDRSHFADGLDNTSEHMDQGRSTSLTSAPMRCMSCSV